MILKNEKFKLIINLDPKVSQILSNYSFQYLILPILTPIFHNPEYEIVWKKIQIYSRRA